MRSLRQEIEMLVKVVHPNVVQFYGVSWPDKSYPSIVLEFCELGALDTILYPKKTKGGGGREPRPGGLPDNLTWGNFLLRSLTDVLEGMVHLHHGILQDDGTLETVVHRDLKPANLLLTSTFVTKIADLGEARVMDNDNTMSMVGTPLYLAPEICRGEHYTSSVDVFSLGIIVNEMDTGHAPYAGKRFTRHGVSSDTVRLRPKVESNVESFQTLVKSMWDHDASKRPSMRDVLDHVRMFGAETFGGAVPLTLEGRRRGSVVLGCGPLVANAEGLLENLTTAEAAAEEFELSDLPCVTAKEEAVVKAIKRYTSIINPQLGISFFEPPHTLLHGLVV